MATTINLSDPIATWVTKTNTISSDLGTKASLSTSTTTNLVAAINELKTQQQFLNLSDVPPGMYMVAVSNQSGTAIQKLVVE